MPLPPDIDAPLLVSSFPGDTNIKFDPKPRINPETSSFRPCPRETRIVTEATPITMPRTVSILLILFDQIETKAVLILSIISILSETFCLF